MDSNVKEHLTVEARLEALEQQNKELLGTLVELSNRLGVTRQEDYDLRDVIENLTSTMGGHRGGGRGGWYVPKMDDDD